LKVVVVIIIRVRFGSPEPIPLASSQTPALDQDFLNSSHARLVGCMIPRRVAVLVQYCVNPGVAGMLRSVLRERRREIFVSSRTESSMRSCHLGLWAVLALLMPSDRAKNPLEQ
jgi:hypothetical protein